jgi:signal transduction histidine kinase
LSPAHAAEHITVASSRQLTLSAMVLIAVTLALMTGFAFWSWRRRQGLASRRREAELALRASEDRLRQATRQLPLAIFEYLPAPVPRFQSISEGVARLLPGSAEEILADPEVFFRGIDPEDVSGLGWRDPAAPPLLDFEWIGRSRTPAATPRWLQIRATTGVTASGERAIHGAMLDVTALKRAQQDLERSREELRRLASHREERVEQERARLAREFHDELGQVLTTARMHLQLLERQLPVEATTARAAAQDIEAMIGEAGRSVKDHRLRPAPGGAQPRAQRGSRMDRGARAGPAGHRLPGVDYRRADGLDDNHAIAPIPHRPGIAEQHRAPCRSGQVHITLGQPRSPNCTCWSRTTAGASMPPA